MKYRKKPIVVEAEQFAINGPIPAGVEYGTLAGRLGMFFYIDTLEGPHIVRDKDWIITGIKGERYPCNPDIFEATYEAVQP